MYFSINIPPDDIDKKDVEDFLSNFPEINVVEESINSNIIQSYYYISSQDIRKFKMLKINNDNDIIDLFKLLNDEELIHNYEDEKPIFDVNAMLTILNPRFNNSNIWTATTSNKNRYF